MNQVQESEDGLDIITDDESWFTNTNKPVMIEAHAENDGKIHIKYRKSNGKNPLRIKDITGVDLGEVDQTLLEMNFTVEK
jgi:hypothetical protein